MRASGLGCMLQSSESFSNNSFCQDYLAGVLQGHPARSGKSRFRVFWGGSGLLALGGFRSRVHAAHANHASPVACSSGRRAPCRACRRAFHQVASELGAQVRRMKGGALKCSIPRGVILKRVSRNPQHSPGPRSRQGGCYSITLGKPLADLCPLGTFRCEAYVKSCS